MKKIGILTFHDALNYGAVLQAYALVQTLKKGGAIVNIINYDCSSVSSASSLKCLLKTKPVLKGIALFFARYKPVKGFTKFRNKYLNLTKRISDISELSILCKDYDVLIVGSDQVWNFNWTSSDFAYLLDIDGYAKEKYSYAASFGNENISKELKDVYANALKDYARISVRELSAKRFIEETLELPCEQHIDPTFLLDQKEWDEISVIPSIKKEYLILYMIPSDDSLQKYANEFAKKHNLDVIMLNRTFRYPYIKHYGGSSPEQFLGLFKKASYIITNSFHGTAFSIIYNKNCYIKLENSRGYNVRSRDLLAQLSLVEKEYNKEYCIIENKDWSKVNRLVSSIANKGKEYLAEIVNSEKGNM